MMKYLKLYESFIQLLKEGVEGKKFILLSGPSASGKTYLAADPESLAPTKIEHWYKNPKADKVLVGTDNFGGDQDIFQKLIELISENGLPELAKLSANSFKDSPWLIEIYKDDFKKWQEAASDEEKKKYEEIRKHIGYLTDPEPKAKSQQRDGHDGRRFGMAWVAYFSKAKTIVFDDVDTGIKLFKVFGEIEDYLIFTPLDWYLKNINSRVNSENKAERIDVNDKESALYQYCKWFQATDKPDLDNKMYTVRNLEQMLVAAKHNNPREILDLLGVKDILENGFYLTTKSGIKPNKIINSRDPSTGRAKDVSELVF
jgi:hypothetical protein